ncbi:hypothetical protein [Niabella sp.]|nr:hypothetical protein [Niabella sp.]
MAGTFLYFVAADQTVVLRKASFYGIGWRGISKSLGDLGDI